MTSPAASRTPTRPATAGEAPARAAARRPEARGTAPRRRQRGEKARLQGHVRLVAAPDYRQLVDTEPLFRRAIPLLTVIFIIVIGTYRASVSVSEHAAAEAAAREELSLLATAIAAEVSLAVAGGTPLSASLSESLPPGATRSGRAVIVADGNRVVAASAPVEAASAGAPLTDVIGRNQPLTTFGARAGVMRIEVPSGEVFATVHHLSGEAGMIAVLQPASEVFGAWRAALSTNVTLFVTTSAVILLLVYAFFAQSTRARTADAIYAAPSKRIDTALTRGRCGLLDWDVARGRMFWTPSMFEVLGMEPRDELMGFREVSDLVHPDDGDLYDLAETLLSAESPVVDRQLRMRHASGRWIWLRLRAELVSDQESGRPHLIGIALDITEQKLLAERSATADMRLRDAIETVSEAFVLWDADNRLVMCNSKYQQLHNLPDSVMKPGTPYQEVMRHTRHPAVSTPLPATEDGSGGERSYEAELGDGRWLQINERRTKDGGYVSVGTDISALKHHEERLMESERQLRKTVTDLRQSRRTLESQAEQLVELAQKYAEEKNRAEEANRTKSEFLANISHELRTPLNAIIGFSEIMQARMFGPLGSDKYEDYCRDIHHSGTYLLGVINDILDMSRIEAGQLDLSVEAVDFDELVSESVRIMTPTASEKSISLVSSFEEGIRIDVDRRAMKQILLNLMSNAVKFTSAGGCVTVRARLEPQHFVMAVEDNGIGIPKRELERLGQPFVQVENQFTKTHQGSGLGLAIARSLTEMHAGRMEIESEVNKGTTVTVRLPRDVSRSRQEAAAA